MYKWYWDWSGYFKNYIIFRLPDNLSEEEKMAAKASVVKVKTNGLKKGINKEKNLLAAKKREFVTENMPIATDLIGFLNDKQTITRIETNDKNKRLPE